MYTHALVWLSITGIEGAAKPLKVWDISTTDGSSSTESIDTTLYRSNPFNDVANPSEKAAELKIPLLYPIAELDFPASPLRANPLGSWITRGSSFLRQREVVLVPNEVGAVGCIWNPLPVGASHFEVDLDFTLLGNAEVNTASDGFAIWIMNSTLPQSLLNFPNERMWHLLGSDPRFSGAGMAFSTTTRENTDRQSVSLLMNNGRYLDAITSVPSKHGLYLPFKSTDTQIPTEVNVWMSVEPTTISGYVKNGDEHSWHRIFQVTYDGSLEGHLAITASNARLPPIDGTVLESGMEVVLKRFRVSTSGEEFANSPKMTFSTRNESVHDLIMNHVLPASEITNIKLESFAIDLAGQIRAGYGEIASSIGNKIATRADIEEVVGQGGAKDDLQKQLVLMNDQLRRSERMSRILTVTLGSIFLVFGSLLYRRMLNLEKRHYL